MSIRRKGEGFTVKLSLAAIFVCLGGYLGSVYGEKYRKRQEFFANWQKFHRTYAAEILYRRRRLSALVAEGRYSGMFADFASQAAEGKVLPCEILTDDENALLCDYFLAVGGSDARSQEAYLRSVKELLDGYAEQSKKESESRTVLGKKLGILAGLTVAVLIV